MRRSGLLALVAGSAAALSSAALAQESFTFTGATNGGALGDPANSVLTYSATGGFQAGSIDWSGFLSPVIANTWGQEAEVSIMGPGGFATTLILGSGTTFSAGTAMSGSALFPAFDPAGLWTFEFMDSFDDGAGADSIWDSIEFTFGLYTPPVAPPSTAVGAGKSVHSLAAGTVNWHTYVHGGGQLIITTDGTDGMLTGVDDTELGLYDSSGNRIANDDDGGIGVYSLIDQNVPAGTYYIAVGEYDTVFNPAGWSVSTSGNLAGGDYSLDIIPAPGAIALAGLGGLVALRRRR